MGGRSALIIRRLLRAILVLWGAVTVVFVILHLSGDPVILLLPDGATLEEIQSMRVTLGLDRPLPIQYVSYLWDLLHGDFGRSIRFGQPAMAVALERVPATFQLASLATIVGVTVAVPMGIVGALRANTKLGEAIMGFTLIGQSTPTFFLSILLILFFSAALHLLPVGGRGELKQLIMPVLALSIFFLAPIARLMRSAMLEVMGSEYVRTARAKGLSEFAVITRHALKNAALPIVTVIGLHFGGLLGGSVVAETIFSWPGVGRLVIQAIDARDYPVVQAAVFIGATWFVLVNTMVDIAYIYLDPRIEHS